MSSTAPYTQTSNVTAVGDSSIVVPSGEGLRLSAISLKFRRKACPDLFDEVTFPAPDDPNRNVQQTSKKGFFTVSYDRGNLTITGTALLAEQ
jgi:hypothetical protein